MVKKVKHNNTVAGNDNKHFLEFKRIIDVIREGKLNGNENQTIPSHTTSCILCEAIKESVEIIDNLPSITGWSSTPIARKQQQMINEIVSSIISNSVNKESFSLIDIGTGDGQLLTKLLCNLEEQKLLEKIMEVVLIDQNSDYVRKSLADCKNRFPGISFTAKVERIQNLNFSKFKKEKSKILCNASSVIHELNQGEKEILLDRITGSVDYFVLTELEGRHGEKDEDDDTRLRSLFEFYHALSVDAGHYSNSLISNYYLFEVLNLISPHYENWGNYHLVLQEWRGLFSDFNWSFIPKKFSVVHKGFKINSFTSLCVNKSLLV